MSDPTNPDNTAQTAEEIARRIIKKDEQVFKINFSDNKLREQMIEILSSEYTALIDESVTRKQQELLDELQEFCIDNADTIVTDDIDIEDAGEYEAVDIYRVNEWIKEKKLITNERSPND